jgi:hypothetical protein
MNLYAAEHNYLARYEIRVALEQHSLKSSLGCLVFGGGKFAKAARQPSSGLGNASTLSKSRGAHPWAASGTTMYQIGI